MKIVFRGLQLWLLFLIMACIAGLGDQLNNITKQLNRLNDKIEQIDNSNR